MADRDRRGRTRRPGQERGLRPLHPELPEAWTSRAVRVAMSEEDWDRLEQLIQQVARDEPTQARALGAALSYLMHVDKERRHDRGNLDWLDWERRKILKMLTQLNRGA